MTKPHSRRRHGGCGAAAMLMLGSMYAWSYFKVALGGAFPLWTEKQITLNFTLMMSFFCLGGLLAGRMGNRVSKPAQMLLAAVLMGAGFFGVSLLPRENPQLALLLLYLCYAGLNGLGTGIAFNAVLSAVQPWFPDRPGLISGVLLMCLGFGSLILGNAAAALASQVGLFSTFRIFAAADLLALAAVHRGIRPPAESDVLPPPKHTSDGGAARSFTTAEMLRRPTFWCYFGWNICMSASGMLVINYASSICVYYGAAATLGLVVSVFNGGGRLVVGWLMDRLGWKNCLYLMNGIALLSGGLMLTGDRMGGCTPLILTGLMLMGACYGSGITICASLIRRFYGNDHYASNMGVANLCTFPAALIGPMIAAALQDAAPGYTSTYVMVLVIAAIALGLNLLIRNP